MKIEEFIDQCILSEEILKRNLFFFHILNRECKKKTFN